MTETENFERVYGDILLSKLGVAIKQVLAEFGHGNTCANTKPCGLVLFMYYDKPVPDINATGIATLCLGHIGLEPILEFIMKIQALESLPTAPTRQPNDNQYVN